MLGGDGMRCLGSQGKHRIDERAKYFESSDL